MKKKMFKAWDIGTQSWLEDFTVDPFGNVLTLDGDENVMTNERDVVLISVLHLEDVNKVTMKESDVIKVSGLNRNEEHTFVLMQSKVGVVPIRLIVEERRFSGETLDNVAFTELIGKGNVEIIGNTLENMDWLIDLSGYVKKQ